MTVTKLGGTFPRYERFSAVFEVERIRQNAVYRIYASKTVQTNLLRIKTGKTEEKNPTVSSCDADDPIDLWCG